MSRARVYHGVKHGKRCACPLCDPEGRLQQRAREDARAARRFAAAHPVLPLAVDRPRAARPLFETEKTKRFRELLRAGVPARLAMEQIDAIERSNGHAD